MQVSYVRQQTINGPTVTILLGVTGAVFIVLGIVVFDTSASVLITLLLIVSRTGSLRSSSSVRNKWRTCLPAHQKTRELESDLVAANSRWCSCKSEHFFPR